MIDVLGRDGFKNFETVKKVTGYPGKIYKKITNIETIRSSEKSFYDKGKAVFKYIEGSKSHLSSPVKDINNIIFKVVDIARKWIA